MILNRFACNWIYLDSRFVDKIRLAHLLAVPFLPTPTLAFSIDNTSATTATPVVTHILSSSLEFQIVHAAIQSISWRITRNRSSSVGCQTVAPVRFRLVAISIYSTWFRTGFLDDFFVSERDLEVLVEGADSGLGRELAPLNLAPVVFIFFDDFLTVSFLMNACNCRLTRSVVRCWA